MTTAYADWTYYSTVYLGNQIAEADFARLSLRASAQIDAMTFNRAQTDTDNTDAIAMATCAVAEEVQKVERGDVDAITSESIGSHSVSYAANSSKTKSTQEKYEAAAKVYLGDTGLMFTGFREGEYGQL